MSSKVTVILGAEKRTFEQAMVSVDRTLASLQQRLEHVARFAQYSLLGVTGSAGFAVRAAASDADSIRRLNTALEASGESVGLWSEKLVKASEEIQRQTVYADEDARKLMLLALTMGAGADKAEEMTRAAIGLSAATAGRLGIDQAMRLAVNAGEEEYAILARIVPAIRNATTEAEKHAIVQDLIQKGWRLAQEEGETFGGSLKKLGIAVGDLGEAIGYSLIPQIVAMTGFVRTLLPIIQQWAAEHQVLTAILIDTSIAGLALVAFGPRLVAVGRTLIAVVANAVTWVRSLGAAMAFTGAVGLGTLLAAVVAVTAAIAAAAYGVYRFNAYLNAGVAQSQEYSKAIHSIGDAQKAVAAAGTDQARLVALNKLIDAQHAAATGALDTAAAYRAQGPAYKANADAAEANARRHADAMQRLRREAEALQSKIESAPKVDEAAAKKLREEFEKDIDAADLLLEQAGKTADEKERLAIAAKGYSAEQVDEIANEIELAKRIQEAADWFDDTDAHAKELHQSAVDALHAINVEIFKMRGGTADQVQLFDLANVGTAKKDIMDIADAMQSRAVEEFNAAQKKLLDDAKARREEEQQITHERELQAELALAGRFETLTGTFERIQQATLQRPISDQLAAVERGKEDAKVQKDLKKLQEDANKKLDLIAVAAQAIAKAPPGATFVP